MPTSNDQPARKLSAHDAAEVAATIGDLSAAGLPLAPGLQATAAELPSGRLRSALERIAASLDRGQTLEQALTAEGASLPGYMRALIAAGVRTGRLGPTLQDFLHFRQSLDDLRRSVWRAIAYPAFLLITVGVMYWLFFAYFLPKLTLAMKEMYTRDYPADEVTAGSLWLAEHRGAVATWFAGIIVALAIIGLLIGARQRRQFLHMLPLFGPLWRLSGVAEFCKLLRTLIARDTPLPEAIRLAADSVRDAEIAAAGRRVAEHVQRGESLAQAIAAAPAFPPFLQPLLAWGERDNSLGQALETGAVTCSEQLNLHCTLVAAIFPPAAWLFAMLLVFRVFAQFAGRIASLTSLTTGPGLPAVQSHMLNSVASLFILALAVVLGSRLFFVGRRQDHSIRITVRIFSLSLLIVAMFALFVVLGGGWGFWLALLALGLMGAAAFRFRQVDRTNLLRLMSDALDRGVPLEPLIRSAVAESTGVINRRGSLLADDLADGIPLPEAIDRNRRALPVGSAVAARVGAATGLWRASLRILDRDRTDSTSRELFEPTRILLFFVTFGFSMGVVTFMWIKIFPAFQKIFIDFHAKLPALTMWVFHIGRAAIPFAALALPVLALVGAYFGLRSLGWIRFDLPVIARFKAPLESAVVLRWCSLAVERDQSLPHLLEFLANNYPRRLIRRRLLAVSADMNAGRDWIDSFRARGLVQAKDAAVLAAAERARNLPWAMREAASSAERNFFYRAHALMQILFPLCVMMLGAVVALFAVGCILPLVQLIQGLAR